jgi:hypothetical protein
MTNIVFNSNDIIDKKWLNHIDGHWNSNPQLPFTVCRPRKTNFNCPFPFAANKWKFAVSVFCLQQTRGSFTFSVSSVFRTYSSTECNYIYMCCHFKQKTEALVIFLNLFPISSLCKRKFTACPIVDKETNGSYPSANRLNALNRLNGLAHLC